MEVRWWRGVAKTVPTLVGSVGPEMAPEFPRSGHGQLECEKPKVLSLLPQFPTC